MSRLKKNVWDFNKIFESVTGVKPSIGGNTSNNKPVPDITDIDGIKMPIAPSTLSGDLKEDLEYSHVNNASPESDAYVIGEAVNRKKVLAKHLKVGDVIIGLGQGLEVVQAPTAGISTPSGKIELVVKYPNGKLYQKIWNGNTVIAIVDNTPVDPLASADQDALMEDDMFLSEEQQLMEIFGDVNGTMDTMGLGEAVGFNGNDENTTVVNPLANGSNNTELVGDEITPELRAVVNEIDFEKDFGDVKPSGFNAKESCINPKELVDYLNRVRANADLKTAEREKFKPKYPYVHAKSQLLPLDKPTFEDVDLEEFKNKIMTKPNSIINTNSKMLKSGQQNEFVYKTGIPAFRGIAYDEAKGNFVVINTCPGAGDCVFICYALSGNYIRYPASYDLMTQRLNLLLNHPDQYQQQMYNELKAVAKLHKALNGYENRIKMRWNDSGDFFSKKYVQIAENVIKQLNAEGYQIDDYAYTKVADVANTSNIGKTTYSSGANPQQSSMVKGTKEKSIVVPKQLFADLDIDKSADLNVLKNRIVHDNEMQRESAFPIKPESIITYNELMRTPIGEKPYWSVIVTPHNGDDAAFRKDVQNVLLTIH